MKTRNGFVSNSSSSSFIIAFKDNIPCPHCGRRDPNILNAIESSNDYSNDNNVGAKGEGVIEEIKGSYYPKQKTPLINQVANFLKDGYTVASISISYHNDLLNNLLNNMQKSGSVVIIYDEEGKYVKNENS